MGRGLHRRQERPRGGPGVDGRIPSVYFTEEWNRLWREVVRRDRWTCQYCGGHGTQADHVTPRSKGGADRLDNLVCCCQTCNEIAGGRLFESFQAKKRYIRATRKYVGGAEMV